jgi:hypothetical protein
MGFGQGRLIFQCRTQVLRCLLAGSLLEIGKPDIDMSDGRFGIPRVQQSPLCKSNGLARAIEAKQEGAVIHEYRGRNIWVLQCHTIRLCRRLQTPLGLINKGKELKIARLI